MSYQRSRARRTFEAQVGQALTEVVPLYRVASRAGSGGGARLLAAYYVFVFAQLEAYIKSLVEDTLTTMAKTNPGLGQWPDLMLAYVVHKSEGLQGHYRRFGITEDESALLDSIAVTTRKLALWGQTGTIASQLTAGAFLERKKYPSPKNLPQLFRRLGLKHTWAVVDSAGRMNGKLILTSLNDLRTDIAHEGKVPTGFGMNDLRDRVQQMQRLVAALDRALASHFCRGVIPRAAWNSAMA